MCAIASLYFVDLIMLAIQWGHILQLLMFLANDNLEQFEIFYTSAVIGFQLIM